MIPVIAIVGRPNVGKSTLFNVLTHTRDALVADFAGLTRDRQYGTLELEESNAIVIDTGGLLGDEGDLSELMNSQVATAISESNLILFIVDAKAGLMDDDKTILQSLRNTNKPILLLVNKIDGQDENVAMLDFHQMGIETIIPIATAHKRNIGYLREELMRYCNELITKDEEQELAQDSKGPNMAVIGRPNVGKSTLVNRLLGENRVLAYDLPGTTRDSICLPLEWDGKDYTLVDTAGVRRRGKVTAGVEKFSVIKTLQAIDRSQVCVLLMDAQEGITDQDMHLLGLITNNARAVVIGLNKWDHLSEEHKTTIKSEFARRMSAFPWVPLVYISALHGSGLTDLMDRVDLVYESATKELETNQLTDVLKQAFKAHQPALIQGRLTKLKYAHSGGRNPQRIIIHGTRTDALLPAYIKYLEKQFRNAFNLRGAPIVLQFKSSKNPYKVRKVKNRSSTANRRHNAFDTTPRKRKW
ncbi:GTP-binding protein EngA [hydrothermal vent metagenome]|uniref:GTPase Der n=1 Tax=hydrothermal vent metagenome TaxID=652676 RepID=A0A3B0VB36_9ZZZZ